MKPPVEAPTSSAARPGGSIPKASSAAASLCPPRLTYGSGLRRPRSWSPGRRGRRACGRGGPRRRPRPGPCRRGQRLGAGARLGQAALDEQLVETDALRPRSVGGRGLTGRIVAQPRSPRTHRTRPAVTGRLDGRCTRPRRAASAPTRRIVRRAGHDASSAIRSIVGVRRCRSWPIVALVVARLRPGRRPDTDVLGRDLRDGRVCFCVHAIWIFIAVRRAIVRRHDLSGVAKAGWLIRRSLLPCHRRADLHRDAPESTRSAAPRTVEARRDADAGRPRGAASRADQMLRPPEADGTSARRRRTSTMTVDRSWRPWTSTAMPVMTGACARPAPATIGRRLVEAQLAQSPSRRVPSRRR